MDGGGEREKKSVYYRGFLLPTTPMGHTRGGGVGTAPLFFKFALGRGRSGKPCDIKNGGGLL